VTLPAADTWNCCPYDEALAANGRYRPAYEALRRQLGWDPLCPPTAVVERLSGQPLGDDHKLVPVPLAVPDSEYRQIQAGVAQRARALQMFFADVFLGDGRYLRSGTKLSETLLDDILASVEASLPQLRQWWTGHNRETLRFVYAPDLLREPSGRWVVIEDNVGCVGGCADSYFALEAYRQATGLSGEPLFCPDLSHAVRLWLDTLGLAPGDAGIVAMLGDGNALAAYRPKRFEEDRRRIQLVRQLGIRNIDDTEFERICQGPEPRARLKAIVNLGVPSRKTWWLIHDVAFNQLRVPLLNSPGTLLLGHKCFLPFVEEMINFYCEEESILGSPPTRLLQDGRLPDDLDNWVLKTATGCQGDGVFVLKFQPPVRLEELMGLVQGSWPKKPVIAQRYVEPSRLCVVGPFGSDIYDVELRALAYVIGWQNVFVGECSIGKLVLTGNNKRVQTVFSGGFYGPVIREPMYRRG
jgi:carboxylate-amine ligase